VHGVRAPLPQLHILPANLHGAYTVHPSKPNYPARPIHASSQVSLTLGCAIWALCRCLACSSRPASNLLSFVTCSCDRPPCRCRPALRSWPLLLLLLPAARPGPCGLLLLLKAVLGPSTSRASSLSGPSASDAAFASLSLGRSAAKASSAWPWDPSAASRGRSLQEQMQQSPQHVTCDMF
jgi:hypothetical protein